MLPLVAFVVALLPRLALMWQVPEIYGFDGYQRWAGRDHLLVRDWLPATQSVIWAVTRLGGGPVAAKLALSVVASGAVAAGALVARRLGGAAAGWLFVPVGLFAPFLAWSVVPYQEGTYLLVLFAALALAISGRQLAADLIAGGLVLVRYEGWPVLGLYLVWRRDPRALVALWGVALWLALKVGVGVQGYQPSPVNYADWDGLAERFDLVRYLDSLSRFVAQAWWSGGWVLFALGLVGMWLLRRQGLGRLLIGVFAVQVGAVLGWLAGVETAIMRMEVVAGVVLGLFAAAVLGRLWARGGAWRATVAVGAVAFGSYGVWAAGGMASRSVRSVRWEERLARQMAACEGCEWVVTPRAGLGTRDRHDGCEILQGITGLHAGQGFWCATWPGEVPAEVAEKAWHATWRRGGYAVSGPPQR